MGIIGSEWYTTNTQRKYPLDDTATGIDDSGNMLPNNILADAAVRFPETLGNALYVGAVTVTANLVTVLLAAYRRTACGESSSSVAEESVGTAVAAVSLPLSDVVEDRAYPLEPLVDGVGGWLVFGEGIREAYLGKFSAPEQSCLAPRAARPYPLFPVTSVGKLGRSTSLKGLVSLLGGNDIKIEKGYRSIEGVERPCFIFSLETSDGDRYTPLETYIGPCEGRPESNTCLQTGVQFLGEAVPDCFGNIDVVFFGNVVVGATDTGVGGMVVEFPLGQSDACTNGGTLANSAGILPSEHPTLCEYGPAYSISSEGSSEESLPVNTESSDVSIPGCFENFNDQVADYFTVRSGEFGFIFTQDAHIISSSSIDSSSSIPVFESSSSITGESLYGPWVEPQKHVDLGWVWRASSCSLRNVAIWDYPVRYTPSKTVRTRLRLTDLCTRTAAGIIFDFNNSYIDSIGAPVNNYYMLRIEPSGGVLSFAHWNGGIMTTITGDYNWWDSPLIQRGLNIFPWTWYELQITFSVIPGGIRASGSFSKIGFDLGENDYYTGLNLDFQSRNTEFLRVGLGTQYGIADFATFCVGMEGQHF